MQANLWSIAKSTAALTAIATIGAVAVSVFQLSDDLRKERTHEWQEAVVFDLIRQDAAHGVTFKAIKDGYADAVKNYSSELPREEIQDPALTRTLLNLLGKNAISVRQDYSFGLKVDNPRVDNTPGAGMDPKGPEHLVAMQNATHSIFQFVHDSPGKYDEESLVIQVRLQFAGLSKEDVEELIAQGISGNILAQNRDGKIRLATQPAP